MSPRGAKLIAACVGVALTAGLVRAQQALPPVAMSGSSGEVLRAVTTSGAIVTMRGPIEVTFRGRTATVRHQSGLTATARSRDVMLFVRRPVSLFTSRIARVTLEPGARVAMERMSPRGGRARLQSAVIDLGDLRLSPDDLQLDALPLAESLRAIPGDGCRVGYFHDFPRRVRTREPVVPRSGPGAPRLRVTIPAGTSLWQHDSGGWVSLTDPSVDFIGWVPASELAPERSSVASDPAGSSAATCSSGTVSTRRSRADAPLTDEVGARTWAMLSEGSEIESGPSDDPTRVPVLAVDGVRRIDRCADPLGWIARAALAGLEPTLSAPPPLDGSTD